MPPPHVQGSRRPTYTVIAGPNGSGKSTLVGELQAQGVVLGPFINPDVIAAGLPHDTGNRELTAGRMALRESQERLAAGERFAREATFTSSEIMRSLVTARSSGFRVDVKFIAVRGVEEAIARVANRVRNGGHDIPEHVQRRRFDKSIDNACRAIHLVDNLQVLENPAGHGHRLVAEVRQGKLTGLAVERPGWVDRIVAETERTRA